MKERKRSAGKGTGKHGRRGARRAAASSPSGAPHPAVVGGIAAAVIGLLVVALFMAGGSGPSVPQEPAPPAPAVASGEVPSEPSPTEPTPTEPAPLEPAPEVEAPAPEVAPLQRGTSFDHATARIKGNTETARVERVVDGDTVALADGRRVRLLGINTPERDRPLYKEAGQVLRELVEGQQVTLEFDELREDKFDRLLAYLHKGDLFVNGEIVRQGMAYTFVWPQNRAHKDVLLEYQQEARMKGVGLWALPVPEEAPLYIGNERAPYFHREGCKRISRLRDRDRVEFRSRLEALDAGMNPCQDCGS